MVYLYQLYAYAGSSTFADFPSLSPPPPPFFFIDTTYVYLSRLTIIWFIVIVRQQRGHLRFSSKHDEEWGKEKQRERERSKEGRKIRVTAIKPTYIPCAIFIWIRLWIRRYQNHVAVSNLIFKWTIRLLFRLNSFESRSIESKIENTLAVARVSTLVR